jgi:hypothetical protein
LGTPSITCSLSSLFVWYLRFMINSCREPNSCQVQFQPGTKFCIFRFWSWLGLIMECKLPLDNFHVQYMANTISKNYVIICAIVKIFSFGEKWNSPFHNVSPSFSWALYSWAFVNLHYYIFKVYSRSWLGKKRPKI